MGRSVCLRYSFCFLKSGRVRGMSGVVMVQVTMRWTVRRRPHDNLSDDLIFVDFVGLAVWAMNRTLWRDAYDLSLEL